MVLDHYSARRGRVYLPQDELAQAGLSDDDIFRGRVTDKWRKFMKGQIKRARMFFDEAERGVAELNSASRWPVWASLLLYSIFDSLSTPWFANIINYLVASIFPPLASKAQKDKIKSDAKHFIWDDPYLW